MPLTHSVASDGTHIFYNARSQRYLILTSGGGVEVSNTIPIVYKNLGNNSQVSILIGTIRLKFGYYVIIGKSHTVTGSILGHDIATVDKFEILPVGINELGRKNNEELQYLKLLNTHLTNATLFFSVDNKYDLTNSLQRQFTTPNLAIDERFFWNKYLVQDLINHGGVGNDFVTPLIYGYFKSHSAYFNGKSLEFALLTRRALNRAGTRYFRRGIDVEGNVANFNETEQFFTSDDQHVFSILQTRGSVPVYWAEINNLKYKPNLVISSQSSLDATAKHFKEQVGLYGDNYLVNLVNQKGYEKPVKEAYENAVDNLPSDLAKHVNYIYFDFHHECKGMKYHRINLLLERLITLGYTSDNYFEYDLAKSTIVKLQNKVVRTNCMDCLDRTNVVQSTVGRWVLQNQLSQTGYLPSQSTTPFEKIDPKFNLFFQNFWADNADAVSCAYSGTGALKTDFTRLGKRTYQGGFNDLVNSITRYYKNNLTDGARQDSYDLFLGKFKPFQDSVRSPFIDKRPAFIQLLPYLIGTSLLILLAVLIYPKGGSVFKWKNLIVIALCVLFSIRNTLYLVNHGYQFVDWPRLIQLDFLKKEDIVDSSSGKIVGVNFDETENFKVYSKKRN
ncbi:Phosphoinositide phosphatase SAC1 [Candida viswanathii]|uniref:Phosphoinositide phosphatase SAC1 n=1 Tax=Candida viswanathii TaxID=5486 RepID=A0A367YEC7_9ASCO|nr:Phosphoinositide phosphatase SAC1 [Candida viswanathii]